MTAARDAFSTCFALRVTMLTCPCSVLFRPEQKMLKVPQYRTWWATKHVRDLQLQTPITISPGVTCREAIDLLSAQGFDTLPVIALDGKIIGVITEGNLTAKLVSNRVQPDDDITSAVYTQFRKVCDADQRYTALQRLECSTRSISVCMPHQVTLNTTLGQLANIFDRDHYALVVSEPSRKKHGGDGMAAATDHYPLIPNTNDLVWHTKPLGQ
jgi:CBS domain-containing protein